MAQQDRFAELLSQLAREVTRRQATEVCCGDLTLEQFQTLHAVDRAERASIGSLSVDLGVDVSTMSRNVSVLERDSYLMRARSEDDARFVHVNLTTKGRRALETLRCSERDVLKDVYDRLPSSERARVMKTLEALRLCLVRSDSEEAACCPPASARKSAS
jgi:DNA-binding MarR family transcriptional regulator